MLKKNLWVVAIFIVFGSGIVSGQEPASISDVIKLQKHFFYNQGVQYFSDELGSCLMKLRPDGRYIRQRYGIIDEGTWQQLEDGRIRLASDTYYNSIYSDEFSVGIYSKEALDQIPAMRERIAGLLAGNERDSFSIREIEEASNSTHDGKEATFVSAFTHQQEFPRADLVDLITAIDAYLKNADKNITYLPAYQYPQYGFFEDDFSSYKVPLRIVENIEKNNIKVPAGDGYIGRLNNLLKVRDLSSHFSKIKLSDENAALLARDAELKQPDLIRLNRIVLEAAYPEDCPRGVPERNVIFLFDETNEFENLDDVVKTIENGSAPRFALRLIDKDRYDALIRKEQEQKLAFEKMEQEYQETLEKEPPLPSAEANIYIFPKGKQQYFELSSIHTSYLTFQPDGRYREILSDHFGVREYDSGTWKQSPDGRIRMVSKEKFHKIEAGSLSVYISDKKDVNCLKVLKKQITGLLNRHEKQSFSGMEIRGLMGDQEGRCASLTVDLDYEAKTTSRNNLQKLQTRIDSYLQDPEKNIFYYMPYIYRDAKFLVDEDSFLDIDLIKKSIHNKKSPFVFMGIDAKQFKEGSSKPQPFRYYPEMNERVEQMQE